MGRAKGLVISHSRQVLSRCAYRGWLPSKLSARLIARFWENCAQDVHDRYGHEQTDFAVLQSVITRYHIQSVLDAGCGSGRLFGLYERCGITRVVGTDISETALQLARAASYQVELHLVRLEDLNELPDSFDLGVCNRVLQHVPERDILRVVTNLCRACCMIYVNELTTNDEQNELYFMRRHDYVALFAAQGWAVVERGTIGLQTYFVFGPLAS